MHFFEIVSIYIMNILLILTSRFWQSFIFQPGGFTTEIVNIRTNKLMATALVCLCLLSLFLSNITLLYTLGGILFIGVIWLFLCGITLVHWLIATYKLPQSALIVFYLSLILPILSGIFSFSLYPLRDSITIAGSSPSIKVL